MGKKTFSSLVVFSIGALLLVFLIRYCLIGYREEAYRDQYIKAGKIRTLTSFLSPHSSQPNYIEFNGKIYRNVLGLSPFYLSLPELQSILFVTENNYGGSTFHIVNTQQKREIEIEGGKLNFGGHIGSHRHAGDTYTDFVEKASSTELVLATQYPHAKTLVFLDLPSRKVQRVEYEQYDEDNRPLERRVYVDGKRIK